MSIWTAALLAAPVWEAAGPLASDSASTHLTPQNPSTLMLALIGIGTLAIYRLAKRPWRSRNAVEGMPAAHITDSFASTPTSTPQEIGERAA